MGKTGKWAKRMMAPLAKIRNKEADLEERNNFTFRNVKDEVMCNFHVDYSSGIF